jgi:hypothetical protein
LVDHRRKTVRLSINEIPEILRKPILLHNYEEVESRIDNLSPLGVGLIVNPDSEIFPGDFFYLKYYGFDSDIKCYCVYCDEDGDEKSIGAYFTEPDDQKLIMKHLHLQNMN